MKDEALLIVADSERNADMLYAVGLFVPDPFIFLRSKGRREVVLSEPEVDRARRLAPHCRIRPWSLYQRRLQHNGDPPPGTALVVRELLRDNRLRRISVPHSFPLGLARELRDLKIKVRTRPEPLFPERQFKSAAEVRKISAALTMAEVGLAEGIHAIHNSRVARDRRLVYRNAHLTAERLRAIIDTAVLQAGGTTARTIVACGRQACDPHEPGQGPLRANQPIVIDVFPRSQRTGYYGDITRTVVKGRASEDVRAMYAAVSEALDLAFQTARAGVRVNVVHAAVRDFLAKRGYANRQCRGRSEGFFHGTGHGLGLDLHEAPQLNSSSTETLRAGNVVAIEPGLYYHAVGGVRLEDIALITSKTARNLTQFEKVLEV